MSVKNFVDYTQATTLTNKIAQRLNSQAAGFLFRGSSSFANLPSTLTAAMVGYTYNMNEAFTTDSRFVEGIGKKYPAGTNVAVADCSTYEAVADPTGKNPATEGWYELVNNKYVLSTDTEPAVGKTYYVGDLSYEFDIPTGFIDVDGINNRIDAVVADLADAFDSTSAYAVGAIVTHNDGLYKFKAAHTENTAWDATEVDAITVEELIDNAEPDSLTTAQVNTLLALLD